MSRFLCMATIGGLVLGLGLGCESPKPPVKKAADTKPADTKTDDKKADSPPADTKPKTGETEHK